MTATERLRKIEDERFVNRPPRGRGTYAREHNTTRSKGTSEVGSITMIETYKILRGIYDSSSSSSIYSPSKNEHTNVLHK